MSTTLPRALLEELFGGNPRAIAAFEDLAETTASVEAKTLEGEAATSSFRDASYVVLSPNTELPNERVLSAGLGITLAATPNSVIIALGIGAVTVQGDFPVTATAQGPTAIVLPLTGVLATLSNAETLSNKVLNSPRIIGLGNYADDTAAASGGVPVNGMYRNGSALMVRVT